MVRKEVTISTSKILHGGDSEPLSPPATESELRQISGEQSLRSGEDLERAF